MCEPTTIAALSAVASLASAAQQVQTASNQRKSARRRAETVRRNTVETYASKLAELGRERANTALQIQKQQKEALRQSSKARVAAGESGFNAEGLLRDIEGEGADAREAARQRHADNAHATVLALQNVERGALANLEAIQPVEFPVAGVLGSLAGAARQVGSVGSATDPRDNSNPDLSGGGLPMNRRPG